jgi:hypothetical protein
VVGRQNAAHPGTRDGRPLACPDDVDGRLYRRAVGEQGRRVKDAALASGISVRTAHKWLARGRACGERAPTIAALRPPAPVPHTGCRPTFVAKMSS